MKKITPFTQSKIAIVSDIHIGIHQNNQTWHKITLDYATWYRDKLKKRGIKDIVICGDVNNDRNEISVNTMSVVYQVFKIWKDFNIKILIGNHDAYYKDRIDVNSLSQFSEWPNIDLIDEVSLLEQFERRYSFCPWGTEYGDIPKSDIVFGHFDISGFKISPMKICAEGTNSSDLLTKGNLIISGHFHLRDERHYNEGKILYVGCPYEMTWSDYNNVKGFYLLDLENSDYEFIENDFSPKHKKIRLSEILVMKSFSETLKKEFQGNIVNFIIDKNITTDKIDALVNKLSLLEPLTLKTEFEIDKKYVDENFNFDTTAVDITQTMEEFINMLDLKNKKDVLSTLLELYKRVSL